MNWLAYFALGIVSGWFLKSLQVEWRMQALTHFVQDILQEMRDEQTPKA